MPGREPDEVDCWAYLRPWVQLIGPAPTFYPGLAMASEHREDGASLQHVQPADAGANGKRFI